MNFSKSLLFFFFGLSIAYAGGDLPADYQADLAQAESLAQAGGRVRKDVTTRLAIPELSESSKPFHMTITYLSDPSPASLVAFQKLADDISDLLKARKMALKLKITGKDQFGPKNDIPVLLLEIQDKEVEALLLKFHQEYGVVEPGMSSKLERPHFHISLKELSASKLLELEQKHPFGSEVTGTAIEAKRLGPCDPFFSEAL